MHALYKFSNSLNLDLVYYLSNVFSKYMVSESEFYLKYFFNYDLDLD